MRLVSAALPDFSSASLPSADLISRLARSLLPGHASDFWPKRKGWSSMERREKHKKEKVKRLADLKKIQRGRVMRGKRRGMNDCPVISFFLDSFWIIRPRFLYFRHISHPRHAVCPPSHFPFIFTLLVLSPPPPLPPPSLFPFFLPNRSSIPI